MTKSTYLWISAAVVVACVVGFAVEVNEDDPRPPSAGGQTSLQPPAPPTTSSPPRAPAPGQDPGEDCRYEDKHPVQLEMLNDNGVTNPDLVMCTDSAQTGSLVKNRSSYTVYFLEDGGGFDYWTEATDAQLDTEVRLFRTGMRYTFAQQQRQPYLTIEPGQKVQFAASAPTTLRFRVDEQEQAAWQSAVLQALLYEQVKDKAQGAAEDYFKPLSPTGLAAAVCTKTAYDVGKTAGAAYDDPSSVLLEDVYGNADGAVDCRQALREAEEESLRKGHDPLISTRGVGEVSESSGWRRITNEALKKAKVLAPELAKVR